MPLLRPEDLRGRISLYAMQKHGTKMLEAAQAAGVRTVVDVFITPMCHHIVEEERARYPGIEAACARSSAS